MNNEPKFSRLSLAGHSCLFALGMSISAAICAQKSPETQISVPIEIRNAAQATPQLVESAKIRVSAEQNLTGPRVTAKIPFAPHYPVENLVIRTEAHNFLGREIRIDPVSLGSGATSSPVHIHLLPSDTAFTYQSGAKYLGVLGGNSNSSVDRALAFFTAAYEDWDKNRSYDEYGYKIWRNYGRALHNACVRDIADTCESAAGVLRDLAGSIGSFEPGKLRSESGLSSEKIIERLEREALEAEQVPLRRALRMVKKLADSPSGQLGDAIALGQAILDRPPAAEIWHRERSNPEQLRRELADYRVRLAQYSDTAPEARTALLTRAIQDYEALIKVRKDPKDEEGRNYAKTLLQQQP